jgi:U3 small nucleolar RNA-associated protein 22
VPFPHPRPPKDAKYKFHYDRPSNVNATGSYPLKTATRNDHTFAIDLVVTMPKTLFQEKDYLNYRYFYKRAYYLACIAAGIKKSREHKFKISFDHLNGNQLQPIIVVQPSGNSDAGDFSASKCVIRILLAVPEKTFAETKLLPRCNCVRPKEANDESEPKANTPTPLYNASIQSDMSITPYLKLLHAASSKSDAFQDACILGRIWLRQRGFASALRRGGFGNFEWAALMAILLQPNSGAGAPVLSSGYSSYQLFKATLQFLAKHNLSKAPYMFQAQDDAIPKTDSVPALFDGPRNMNILFKMTPWSYAQLQREARTTIDIFRDDKADHFESTFILKTDLSVYHYDATLEIPISSLGLDPATENHDQDLAETCRVIYNTLLRALTDRATSISFKLPDGFTWKVDSEKPSEDPDRRILVNIGIDPANASRTIDHGPSAENKTEAASFRRFWGEKAELRRFKDGSILESVVWSTKDTSASVLEQIVRYIISKHLGAQVAAELRFTHDVFSHLIPSGHIQASSGISIFASRMAALASLEKDIRGLEGLPLQIRHINAADPLLRYSTVDAESTQTPASLVLQFEGSARWPDDLSAIQRTKIAFLLKLSDLLSAEKPGYTTRVGLENPSQPSQNQAYLDIILPTGYGFRIRIHHDREATLLDRQLKDKSLDAQSRESAASALAAYKRDYLHTPAHTQTLQILCTRYPALSPSLRLTKRWFASHLLSPHFSAEFIELLVVRTFLQPYPWNTPACATTGFLRTLMWISRWDWRHVPLVVDFSSNQSTQVATEVEGRPGALKTEDIEKIQTRFDAWRRIDPAMNRVVLFAATNLDADGTTWTDRAKPEKVVAARMTALTRAATNTVREQEEALISRMNGKDLETETTNNLTPESIFVPRLADYDIVVRLSSKISKLSKKKAEPKYKNLEMQNGGLGSEDRQNIGFNPVALFVEDLQQIYGDAILWFWDSDTQNDIVGLWNPAVTGQRPWKVKAGWNSVPIVGKSSKKADDEEDGAVDIQVNKAVICNEIRRLGGGLIKDIEIH